MTEELHVIPGIKKKIVVDDCVSSCPQVESCKVWAKLNAKEKVFLFLVPKFPKFILSECPLEPDEAYLPLVRAYEGLKNKTNPHDFLEMFMRQADAFLIQLKETL